MCVWLWTPSLSHLNCKALVPRSPPVSQSPSPAAAPPMPHKGRRDWRVWDRIGLGFRACSSGVLRLHLEALCGPLYMRLYGPLYLWASTGLFWLLLWASMGLYGLLSKGSMGLYGPLLGLYGGLCGGSMGGSVGLHRPQNPVC